LARTKHRAHEFDAEADSVDNGEGARPVGEHRNLRTRSCRRNHVRHSRVSLDSTRFASTTNGSVVFPPPTNLRNKSRIAGDSTKVPFGEWRGGRACFKLYLSAMATNAVVFVCTRCVLVSAPDVERIPTGSFDAASPPTRTPLWVPPGLPRGVSLGPAALLDRVPLLPVRPLRAFVRERSASPPRYADGGTRGPSLYKLLSARLPCSLRSPGWGCG
jgi:hypothetical protein